MADNFNTPVPSGTTFATDDVGGVQYPRTKVSWGVDGAAVDTSNTNPLPVDVRSQVLPTGASTSALQTALNALVTSIGTRAYTAGISRLSVGASSSASAGIAATEVLLHASTRMFVRVSGTATVNDIPLEAGEKFHLKITSGQTINAIRDSADGVLNIVPVA